MSEQPHTSHGDDHGHGHGSPHIQHHYDDAHHQFESGKLGIWLFLAQEVLFFSALFVAYVLYRYHHPEIYSYAHKYLDVKMGAINTAVLIFSSGTAAWAVRCAQKNQRKGLIVCLSLTILCALAFLGIKYIEYSHKIHEHLLFGERFDPCVSSGGQPLVTKNNQCPGHKSTVDWDLKTRAPMHGCFADIALDQDPRHPGVQAECSVFELTGALATTTKPGGTAETSWIESGRRPITAQCPELTFGHEASDDSAGGGSIDSGPRPEDRNLLTPMAPLAGAPGSGHGKQQHPCWQAGAQPAVCRPGWFFTWRCSGPICAKEFGTAGPFASTSACNEERATAEAKLKSEGAITMSACTRSGASGIIVDYGDHAERGKNTRIVADCKAPPPPADPGDLGADRLQKLELGKPLIDPVRRPTAHELHEREAAGPPPEHTGMFFTIYFAMTGLHGIHVLFGVFVFVWLLIRAIKGQFTSDYFGPVDYAALYWHIVDLIWIFLFPLLYLIH